MKANASVKRTAIPRAVMNVLYPLMSLGLVLAIWAIIAKVNNNPLILPAPDVVIKRFFTLFGENTFWISIGWTLARMVIAFLCATVAAFILSALGTVCQPIHKIASPMVSILRAAPTMAVILLLMIWLDYSEAPVVIGFLIAFPVLYPAFYTAFTGVDRELVEMCNVYKVKPIDKILHLYVPEIAPAVLDASRSTLSLTLKVVIAAEVLCYARNSIGLQMQRANLTFDIAYLLAWTMLAILLSFLLEGLALAIKKLWEASR